MDISEKKSGDRRHGYGWTWNPHQCRRHRRRRDYGPCIWKIYERAVSGYSDHGLRTQRDLHRDRRNHGKNDGYHPGWPYHPGNHDGHRKLYFRLPRGRMAEH